VLLVIEEDTVVNPISVFRAPEDDFAANFIF